MALTENNRQYYEGAQTFRGDGVNTSFTATFDTGLIYYSLDPTNDNYALNNFKVYVSPSGLSGTYVEQTNVEITSVVNNVVEFAAAPADGNYIVIQLKTLDGGKYGNNVNDRAYGTAVENNYGSYQYISLQDAIQNFMVGYVGDGKLIQKVKKSDVIFFAKRALQEFSYDTLKSIKSMELTVPNSASIVLPQDYVNYVNVAWYDNAGIKHPILPVNNLTINPYELPLQDNAGVPIQDIYDVNIQGTSIVEDRFRNNTSNFDFKDFIDNTWLGYALYYGDWGFGLYSGWGELYGLEPQYANMNGYFSLNDREGKMSFSSDLVNQIIVLEYISDGLADSMDTKIPKLAEEALYAAISHSIIASRINQPEYIVARLKKERYAKLRNAKIRLSNIKLEEIVQVMRGKSKWIKH
jgi:hypothetical protein